MQLVTYEDYLTKLEESSYWRGRWDYFSEVLNLLGKIQPTPETILELGTNNFPICKESDRLDLISGPGVIRHDITKVPWPVSPWYDITIGLQIWEHLGNRQAIAFEELMRVSRRAILSFPLGWDCPSDAMHHGITREKIAEWTLGIKPMQTILVPNPNRIIYYWEF